MYWPLSHATSSRANCWKIELSDAQFMMHYTRRLDVRKGSLPFNVIKNAMWDFVFPHLLTVRLVWVLSLRWLLLVSQPTTVVNRHFLYRYNLLILRCLNKCQMILTTNMTIIFRLCLLILFHCWSRTRSCCLPTSRCLSLKCYRFLSERHVVMPMLLALCIPWYPLLLPLLRSLI